MAGLYFDDIFVGQTFEAGPSLVTHDDIVDFARRFDRNPFHLDEAAAHEAGLPDIIASGFHTLSLSFALFFELHLWDEAILPSPGLDAVRWTRPLYPGEEVSVRVVIVAATPSTSRPDRGVVAARHETFVKGVAEPILIVEAMHRLRRRPA